MTATKFRRRNYFTKKNFQSRFIMRFIMASYVGNILSVIFFNSLASRKIDSVLFSMKLPAVSTGSLLFREAMYANSAAVLLIVLIFVMTSKGIYSRISRSLFRIRADLMRLGKGDLGSRVMLSEDDEFGDFAEELNFMAAELGRRFQGIQSNVRSLSESAKNLRISKGTAEGKVIREKILQHVNDLQEEVRGFKL